MARDILSEKPKTPCPDPPAHHVESDACRHGWITWDKADDPIWIVCDCEDPANPWPPRKRTDGPIDCDCYFCNGKPRQDRGRARCENENHHCPSCHDNGQCTTVECLDARAQKEKPLDVAIVDDQLIISIGVDALCRAIECSPDSRLTPYNEQTYEFDHTVITSAHVFASAMVRELVDEEEDGTTPLHKLFDNAAIAAIENGADGVALNDDESETTS